MTLTTSCQLEVTAQARISLHELSGNQESYKDLLRSRLTVHNLPALPPLAVLASGERGQVMMGKLMSW
jgi:hypothetical protein